MQDLKQLVISRLSNQIAQQAVAIAELDIKLTQALQTISALEKELDSSGNNREQGADK